MKRRNLLRAKTLQMAKYSDFCIFAKLETQNIKIFCEILITTQILIEYTNKIMECRTLLRTN